MLDHISTTVSDISAAERFYDAIMKALDVVKVGRGEDFLGYGERARAAYPERVYIAIYKGPGPKRARVATGASRRSGGVRSMRSGMPGSPPAALTTVRPACANITRRIMPRS